MDKKTQFNSWLLIEFDYGKNSLDDLHLFEDELERLINPSGLGELDGDDVAVDMSDGSYWIVCNDPLKVYELIKDSLAKTDLVKIKEVKKREKNEEVYTTIFKI